MSTPSSSSATEAEPQELERTLGLLPALAIGTGTMVGAGIIRVPGPGAGKLRPRRNLPFRPGGLTVVPTHGFDRKSGFKGKDEVFGLGPRNGMHSFDNACLFVDDADVRIEDADLYDIAPTVLELLDLDYDRTEFDGSSLLTS